ncbi:hypothetical protein [Actinophytocola sp.]|uniref:hypothetical protein n=1 Tax=Actinophytocola sp. TaxID=1872138 RepID=UPI00389AEE27
METSNSRQDGDTEQNQSASGAGVPQADEAQGTYRELRFEEFPDNGHMLVVFEEWDAVYWLADRHAVIRGGSVELDGPGQRLLEARADDRGMVTFRHVREYNVAEVVEGTPAARAVAQLTDPDRIEETLYPPYIADTMSRPKRPYLQHPEGLIYRNAVVLDRERHVIYWLLTDYDRLENSGVFEAMLGGYGPVYWGGTCESTSYPEWVLPYLINDALSRW